MLQIYINGKIFRNFNVCVHSVVNQWNVVPDRIVVDTYTQKKTVHAVIKILAAAVLGLRLGAGDVELLVRAPLWLVAAQAGGLVLGAAALVAAVWAWGAPPSRGS